MAASFLFRTACVFACFRPSMHKSILDLKRLTLPHLFLMTPGFYDPNFAQNEYLIPINTVPNREIFMVSYRIDCYPPGVTPSYLRTFPWVDASEVAKRMTIGQNCASYLKDDKIYVSTENNGEISTKIKTISPMQATLYFKSQVLTATPGIKQSLISDCCDQQNCSHLCAESRPSNPCYLNLYTPDNYGFTRDPRYEYEIILSIPCVFCKLTSCATQCQNGQFSSDYTFYNEDQRQVNPLTCLSCPPGTWNTCKEKDTCNWRIPSSSTDRTVGPDIYSIPGGPVENCYPCSLAASFPIHFFNSTKAAVLDTTRAWKCPGGSSPPINCPNADFVQSRDGSACVCKPGLYAVNNTHCTLCPKGHRCPDGTLEKCPMHYYQPEMGQTACRRCVDSTSDTGFYPYCLARGHQLKFCDPNVAGTQDRELDQNCIPCNQCKRPYVLNEAAGQSRCYRDR